MKHGYPWVHGSVHIDLLYGLLFRTSRHPFLEREIAARLPRKRRENTYRDEAVDDWVMGRRATVATYYGGRFVRFFDRGGWSEWEDIA